MTNTFIFNVVTTPKDASNDRAAGIAAFTHDFKAAKLVAARSERMPIDVDIDEGKEDCMYDPTRLEYVDVRDKYCALLAKAQDNFEYFTALIAGMHLSDRERRNIVRVVTDLLHHKQELGEWRSILDVIKANNAEGIENGTLLYSKEHE